MKHYIVLHTVQYAGAEGESNFLGVFTSVDAAKRAALAHIGLDHEPPEAADVDETGWSADLHDDSLAFAYGYDNGHVFEHIGAQIAEAPAPQFDFGEIARNGELAMSLIKLVGLSIEWKGWTGDWNIEEGVERVVSYARDAAHHWNLFCDAIEGPCRSRG